MRELSVQEESLAELEADIVERAERKALIEICGVLEGAIQQFRAMQEKLLPDRKFIATRSQCDTANAISEFAVELFTTDPPFDAGRIVASLDARDEILEKVFAVEAVQKNVLAAVEALR